MSCVPVIVREPPPPADLVLGFAGPQSTSRGCWYTKFRDDRPTRSRVILGKPERGCIDPSELARIKRNTC